MNDDVCNAFRPKLQEEGEIMREIYRHWCTMVLPSTVVGDLRIKDGVIAEISTEKNLEAIDGELVHDATGLHLLPGIIDPQVHLELGHLRRKTHTGSAAASGGVISFLDMPNNVPSQTTLESMYSKLETAAEKM